MMIATTRFLLGAACLGMLATTAGALAQQPPPTDSNISLSAPGLLLKKPPPGPPAVKAQPLAWPRLDAGAVLCRTEDDLDRLAARRRGEAVDGPIGCQILRVVTGITIVQRKGPGKTEVKTNDPQAGGSGWTDVWLPDKAPPRASSASR
jgi:hypothetical protein